MQISEKPVLSLWTTKIRASLELMRPANIVTAFADILAGFAAAGGMILITDGRVDTSLNGLSWLLLATFGLYSGGVVLNDVFDAELDTAERPERAIPSGRISKTFAAVLGTLLLAAGILFAFQLNITSGYLALIISLCVLVYDIKAKHSVIWGPLFMGLCRGGNLLLGVSIVPFLLVLFWPLAFLPVIYIGAITLISQGEVEGGSKTSGRIALLLISLIILLLLLLGFFPLYELTPALPFIALFSMMVLPAFLQAAMLPEPARIKKAVKRGVLSLIILNSAIAAGFAGFLMGVIILILLPISMLLGKAFAVT